MFIARNNDLIILANNNKKELENQLKFMVYTDIEETDIQYTLYNGQYLTLEEVEQKEIEKRKQEILNELDKLDLKSIRAIRAEDQEYIEKYEQEAKALREELRKLGE